MKTKLYEIPGKLEGYYYPENNLIIDHWTNLSVTFEEWKSTIYDIGILDFAAKNQVKFWITDSSEATGVFKSEIQEFRESTSSHDMAKSGIQRYFTVLPKNSSISKLSLRMTSKAYSGRGAMLSHAVETIEEAMEMIR